MKHLLLTITILFFSLSAWAQPNSFDLNNMEFINFLKSGDEDDGVRMGRFSGSALRIQYKGNVLAFDALDNQSVIIKDENSVGRVLLNPAGDSYFYGGALGLGITSPQEFFHIKSTSSVFGQLESETNNQVAWKFVTPNYQWTMGLHSGDEGKFKLAYDMGLGTNDVLMVGSTGVVEMINDLHVGASAFVQQHIGGMSLDGVISEQENGYVRSSVLSSRDADLTWDENSKEWTLGAGNHNDFAGWIHRNDGQLSFYSGEKAAFTSLSDDDFRAQFERISIRSNGKVGIGVLIPDAMLTVNGDILASEVRVESTGNGPDYVFEESYDLTSLEDLEAYIQKNKHLPEVPSAVEMKEEGIELAEMNMILLKKVEELTLHVIELNNTVKMQQDQLSALIDKK